MSEPIKIMVDVDVLEALLFFGESDDAQSPLYLSEAKIVSSAAPDLRKAIADARRAK